MNEGTESAFRLWLKTTRGNSDSVIRDKISRCRRVERHYGDLDELDQGRIEHLLELLCSSPSGEPRHGIPIRSGSNLAKVTSDLKNAVRAYLEFRCSRAEPQIQPLG